MSVESCQEFLRATREGGELGQQLKAVTGIAEVIALAGRHGYTFDAQDLRVGSSTFTPAAAPGRSPARPTRTAFHHHEYNLADLPGFKAVLDELPRLKTKPPSVDLGRFDQDFREDDLQTTSNHPADPDFQAWHQKMMRERRHDTTRRDFHLINLDENVDYPGYHRYFEAKTRVISALEDLFDGDVRFSGSMWYPPASYRLWHTNEDQPGWRMYVVDVDEPFTDPAETSFFRYMNPQTEEIVTLREGPRIVRFFRIEQDPDKLFWHCIVNPTRRHRWSFGFEVPENWLERVES